MRKVRRLGRLRGRNPAVSQNSSLLLPMNSRLTRMTFLRTRRGSLRRLRRRSWKRLRRERRKKTAAVSRNSRRSESARPRKRRSAASRLRHSSAECPRRMKRPRVQRAVWPASRTSCRIRPRSPSDRSRKRRKLSRCAAPRTRI